MRCIYCGRESDDGVWTTSGFLCRICASSGFSPCDRCGMYFKTSELNSFAGGNYCNDCFKGLKETVEKEKEKKKKKAPPKIKTAGGVKIKRGKPKIEISEFEEVEPSTVQKKAAEALGIDSEKMEVEGKEERGKENGEEKGTISGIISKIKSLFSRKRKNKEDYDVKIV